MSPKLLKHILQVHKNFQIEDQIVKIEPFGHGHINHTFRLFNQNTNGTDYLLQQINHHVFPQVHAMMDNIQEVLTHLGNKMQEGTYPFDALKLIPTREDNSYFRDINGMYWRIFDFKKHTRSYEIVQNEGQAYQGGLAFGSFLNGMSDFNPSKLYVTLPKFHNVFSRFLQLGEAIETGPMDRLNRSLTLIKKIYHLVDEMTKIEKQKDKGLIPIRITHNDTKFNNVLLDQHDKANCVVDLDTIMPGIVHYDFGDGIRTSCNLGKEGEEDLSKIQFSINHFKGFANGYLDGSRALLSPLEINYLARSGASIAFIMGLRFLTDFLKGDHYYKTHYPEENYHRAASQIELAHQIYQREKDLKEIISHLN